MGLLLTAASAAWFAAHEAADVDARLALVAADVEARIAGRLDTATSALATVTTAIAADALSEAEAQALLADGGVMASQPGIRSLAWVPASPSDASGTIEIAAAVRVARDTAGPAMVPVGGTATAGARRADAVLLVVPAHEGESSTLGPQRRAYLGAAVATIAPEAFFGDIGGLPVVASIHDPGAVTAGPARATPIWSTSVDPPPDARTFDVPFADRRLELSLAPADGFPVDDHTTGFVTLAGTLLSFLVAALVAGRLGRKQRLEAEVAERTRELERANEQLQRAGALRSQFITTVSHELRTPLTSVLGFVQTVRRIEALEPQVRDDFLARAERNGVTLRRMIEELLDFGRLERGELELDRRVVDVGRAVARIAGDLRPAMGARGIDVDVEGGVLAEVDQAALHRILANLLSNSAKYAPVPDPVELTVRRRDHAVEIVCADRGPGFDPDDLPKLLERFVRGAGVMGQGTGIGLALVRELALAHGGDTCLRNRAGGGAEVIVTLPAVHASIAPTAGVFTPGMARVD